MPIVLKVRFKYLVAQVVFGLAAGLSEAGDVSYKQISKRVAS